jgi:hypothetical protein
MPSKLIGTKTTIAMLSLALLLGYYFTRGGGETFAGPNDNKYVGSEQCKNCHSSVKKGDQFGKWLKQKHSHAFALLASDEAKKTAAEKKVADPQKSADCLKCHSTEVPAEQKGPKFDPTQGVQCETCHGPGGKHVAARKAFEPEEGKEDDIVEIAKDEIIASPTADTCRKCHSKDSPSYKPFAFKKYAKEIQHLDPRKKRAADYIDKLPDDPKDDPDAAKVEFKK